jgi:hypothetical protein
VYDVFDKADPLEPREIQLLECLKDDCLKNDDLTLEGLRPTEDLAVRLSKLNTRDQNAFMNAAFHKKHEWAIKLLMLIPDPSQRRNIVTQASKSRANVLHIAASRGNLEFLLAFKDKWSSWGLSADVVAGLLIAPECHGATPIGMAEFQHGPLRGRDRSAEILVLSQLVVDLLRQLEAIVQPVDVLYDLISFP